MPKKHTVICKCTHAVQDHKIYEWGRDGTPEVWECLYCNCRAKDKEFSGYNKNDIRRWIK